ncbi:MAG: KTSC domain-containing protein [Alphaproteobacteria bacterium]|nr:KTSC domain-containing protein [Alphaproteobacteria bacterium]
MVIVAGHHPRKSPPKGLRALALARRLRDTRSSFINRACYDKAQQLFVVKLKATYYPYCEMPAATYQAFLDEPSMGKIYNANIKGTGSDGPFDCRSHRVPQY